MKAGSVQWPSTRSVEDATSTATLSLTGMTLQGKFLFYWESNPRPQTYVSQLLLLGH